MSWKHWVYSRKYILLASSYHQTSVTQLPFHWSLIFQLCTYNTCLFLFSLYVVHLVLGFCLKKSLDRKSTENYVHRCKLWRNLSRIYLFTKEAWEIGIFLPASIFSLSRCQNIFLKWIWEVITLNERKNYLVFSTLLLAQRSQCSIREFKKSV